MPTHKYKVGDVVRLKPKGSPEMTVQEFNASGKIWCSWFSGKKLERGLFAPESIVPVVDEEDED